MRHALPCRPPEQLSWRCKARTSRSGGSWGAAASCTALAIPPSSLASAPTVVPTRSGVAERQAGTAVSASTSRAFDERASTGERGTRGQSTQNPAAKQLAVSHGAFGEAQVSGRDTGGCLHLAAERVGRSKARLLLHLADRKV